MCSRRQAEKLIEQGIVKVNGRRALSNLEVDPLRDEISLFTQKGEYFPVKETTRVWLFYKPMGMICTHKDPSGRPTIFEYLQKSGKVDDKFVISVGRLDYNSEGLMILTNDGELARAMESPESKLERTYRVRVYGRFSDEKLAKIREGCVINGVRYGPFKCNVDSYQTSNTWLMVSMRQGKNREIRRVMQKNDLRVNRLKRLTYGPYSLSQLQAGEVREDIITPEIKKLLYLSSRMKLKKAESQSMDPEDIKKQVEDKLVGRLLDPTSILRLGKQNQIENKPVEIEAEESTEAIARREAKEKRRALNK